MEERQVITEYLHSLLAVDAFKDYCPNGLQVEGSSKIYNIVSGASISNDLILRAIELNADTILVHHGLFWKGDQQVITSITKNRLALLLKHNINLLAYHLPLDVHSLYGNNVLFAKHLGLDMTGSFDMLGVANLGSYSKLDNIVTTGDFVNMIKAKLDRSPLHLVGGEDKISKVAWCTGAAQDGIIAAKAIGADAYISGEVSERTYYLAKELGIHYFAAGHHATEVFGARALGEHLADKYNLKHSFVNAKNPV